MKLLVVVSTTASAPALLGITAACLRRGQPYGCFVTGKGVHVLVDPKLENTFNSAERAVVCEYSWSRYFPDQSPPIEEGSQTDHSTMIGEADHVVSI